MNNWQALKKIIREQFFHPAPEPELMVGYYVVNTATKTIVRRDAFLTEKDALAYIEYWRKRGGAQYLEVYMGARKLADQPVDESYWKYSGL